MWLNGRKDGIDWIDVISKNGECFGAVSRMGVARAPRRAGQPRGGRGGRRRGRLRRSHRGPHGRVGTEPARQGHRLQQEPDRGVLPGSPDPPAPHDDAEQLHGLRGVLALPQGRGELRGDRALGRCRSASGSRCSGTPGAEFGVEDGDKVEATIIGNVLKGYINGVEMITADRRHICRRARRASASTSASATPTSTTASRSSRSTPTTTERERR